MLKIIILITIFISGGIKIKRKLSRISIFIIILILVGSNTGTFAVSYFSTRPAETQTINDLNDSAILNNFTKINKYDYDSNCMNCSTKSILFAKYLYSIGEKPKIISIGSKKQEYGHMAVLWKGNVYDPTFTPAFYNQPKELYLEGVKKMGFDGVIVISDYIPQKFD